MDLIEKNNELMGVSRSMKREALRAVIYAYTGTDPIINKYDNYDEIDFTPEQKRILQNQLTKWQTSEPGAVRVKTGGILLPWSLKNYWKYIAGILGAGVLIGVMVKR